jgi:transglutaminase-like putative cysteine protease
MTAPNREITRPSALTLSCGWLLGFGGLMISAHPASATESPTVVKLATEDYVVQADGTYVVTTHVEYQARNDSAARQAAQQTIKFSDEMEQIEVVEAYTKKADGSKLPVAESAIFTQVPQGAPNVTAFDDQKQKVIIFPSVAAGDIVAYTIREHVIHPMFPGQFYVGDAYPTTVSVEESRGTITAPKSMPLSTEGHDLTFRTTDQGQTVLYQWAYSKPDAVARDLSVLSTLDRSPRFFVSSFKDYDQFGQMYAQLVAPLIEVTPKVKAMADTITAGITDRREQAEKIYNWVSANIRYVGIELGRGAVVPHSAEAILANGYGDCKDHTVIFAALLQAEGLESQVVLVT